MVNIIGNYLGPDVPVILILRFRIQSLMEHF